MNALDWFLELGHNGATRNAANAIEARRQAEHALELQLSHLAWRDAPPAERRRVGKLASELATFERGRDVELDIEIVTACHGAAPNLDMGYSAGPYTNRVQSTA